MRKGLPLAAVARMGAALAMTNNPDWVVPMNMMTRAKNCQVLKISDGAQSTRVPAALAGAAPALTTAAGGT